MAKYLDAFCGFRDEVRSLARAKADPSDILVACDKGITTECALGYQEIIFGSPQVCFAYSSSRSYMSMRAQFDNLDAVS